MESQQGNTNEYLRERYCARVKNESIINVKDVPGGGKDHEIEITFEIEKYVGDIAKSARGILGNVLLHHHGSYTYETRKGKRGEYYLDPAPNWPKWSKGYPLTKICHVFTKNDIVYSSKDEDFVTENITDGSLIHGYSCEDDEKGENFVTELAIATLGTTLKNKPLPVGQFTGHYCIINVDARLIHVFGGDIYDYDNYKIAHVESNVKRCELCEDCKAQKINTCAGNP